MRIELAANDGITWVDPAHVIAVQLVPPRAPDRFDPLGAVQPWHVSIALDTGVTSIVYSNTSRIHARTVAGAVADCCPGVQGTGDREDVHAVTPQTVGDSNLLDEPYRHSTEVPPARTFEGPPV